MKKKRVGGCRPPGLSGLKINTGTYVIPTTLRRDEIDAMVAKLQTIQGRNVSAYEHVAQIADKLLAKPGAITLEGDVAQVQHAKSFAKGAAAANNVKREKYDKAENVANIIIGVLERIRSAPMTGGDGFFEGLKEMIGIGNKNKAVTSGPNVQAHDIPELEVQPMQQNNLTQQPNNNTNTHPIVNEEVPSEETSIKNQPMINETFNNQAGGKRRKSKTRKHKKSHKRH